MTTELQLDKPNIVEVCDTGKVNTDFFTSSDIHAEKSERVKPA